MLRFRCEIVPDDLEAVCRQYFRAETRPPLRWAVAAAAVLGLALALPALGLPLAGSLRRLLVFLLLGVVASAAAAHLWYWIALRRAIAVVRPAAAAAPAVIPVTIETDEAGVAAELGGERQMRPWRSVADMRETRDFLVIRFRDGVMNFVPKRGLSAAEIAAFHREAAARPAAARV